MAVIALIPARGGSKGIPRKSIAPCAGRPLLGWSVAAALAARSIDRVVCSTDDAVIAEVAREQGAAVPFMRPAACADDAAPMIAVLQHALDALGGEPSVDALVLLQPTSPLRRAGDIDACVDLLLASDAASVVTVVPVPHHFNPVSVLRRDADGRVAPFLPSAGDGITRRQDKPVVWARNGPAVLALRPALIRAGRLYDDSTRSHVMAEADSLDVDTPGDLEAASSELQRRYG